MWRWLLAACAGVLIAGAGTSAAFAADPHAFDPALSLTGSCAVSELDPVVDPGLCPMPPGVPGVDHPSVPFREPTAITTDEFGDIYVANRGLEGNPESRIDVFGPTGRFITEIDDGTNLPHALAVDGEGNLYVSHATGAFQHPEFGLLRYPPSVYEPATGEIEYGDSPVGLEAPAEFGAVGFHGLDIDPVTDRLYVKFPGFAALYKSAAEGNGLVEEFGFGLVAGRSTEPVGIAVDRAHNRIYLGSQVTAECPCVQVLKLAPPHELLFTITGSAVPSGDLVNQLALAADEGTGHLFVSDGEARKVYELDLSGKYLATIEHHFKYLYGSEIGLDNGAHSPNGALNPDGRYLYVPSEPGSGETIGHSYAFGPAHECEPVVESLSFGNVSDDEAELRASIEPCGLPTHYTFEYVTQQQFEAQGGSFTGAQVAGEGDIAAGGAPVSVAAGAAGLQPGTAYRFRAVASNKEGSDEAERAFATYPPAGASSTCPNEALRTGLSALLPDCRAYELVTPPETNARPPRGAASASNVGIYFNALQASPDGSKVSFQIDGGSLPGAEATGSLSGDPYLARRSESGWSTSYTGPSGFESPQALPGSTSPDQGYSFWESNAEGSAAIEGAGTTYVRYPDGHSALVGRGSIGVDPRAEGKLISEDGDHIIFTSNHTGNLAVRLTEDAPPSGTAAIYDRTADEVTHVVSLLPGNKTPEAGENAFFEGVSLDGSGVAFGLGENEPEGPLYLRFDNAETYEVGDDVTFAGVAEGGSRVFYLEGGNLYRLDVATGIRTAFTSGGSVTPVNVSADGAVAYFVSPNVLVKTANPNGVKPLKGAENLYRSQEGVISFVATVTEEDVTGEATEIGLGTWTPGVVSNNKAAQDPSRSTPDGSVLLFESRASLTGYDSDESVQIYRYDAAANLLECLSCNPTLAPATGEASLQSVAKQLFAPEPLGRSVRVDNLAPDGRRAFFQSTEALAPADTDRLQDVYEWEAQGVGSCERPQGCTYLISSGHSRRTDYLFAVSASGDDVFFRSGDILLPSDLEETPSIYDARVDGGFPEAAAEECDGEGCRPLLTLPPPPPSSHTAVFGKGDDVRRPRRCPKGKRSVKRHGKVHCIKKAHHRRHHRKADKSKQGGRK